MKIAVDANILVRAAIRDDPGQTRAAEKLLRDAELIAVSTACLCEFVWVLRRTYKLSPLDTAFAIRALLGTANVIMNRPAVEAGLLALEAGTDFADGVMAFEGVWLGGDSFVSFDKAAVASSQGKVLERALLA